MIKNIYIIQMFKLYNKKKYRKNNNLLSKNLYYF